ncbi:hypothetical protein CTH30272_03051 [Allocatenococcus thiocycli]|nr:hypothetical protein CTH30272_03051 [Catenococcus thiocycli]
MRRILKSIFLIFFITASFQVFAADCTDILDDSSQSVAVKETNYYTICDEDLAARVTNLLFADAYNNDELIKKHYEKIGLPTPPASTGTASMLSQTVSAVGMSINYIFFRFSIVVIMALVFVGVVSKGLGKNFTDSIKDSDNWKALAMMALVFVLVWPASQFAIGQTLAIAALGIGLTFSNYLLSAILPIFSFSAELDENSVTANQFKSDGLGYAANMTTLMLASKMTQATFNRTNSPYVKGEFNDEPSDLSDISSDSTDGTFEWFSGTTNRKVTINDYVKNMLTQSSTEIIFSDIYQFENIYEQFNLQPNSTINARVISGQVVSNKSNAVATSTIDRNLSSVGEIKEIDEDGELVESFLELDLFEEQVFDSVFFAGLSADLATEDPDIIKALVDSKLVNEFASSVYAEPLNSNNLENLSQKLVSKAEQFASKNTKLTDEEKLEIKKEYLNAAQAYFFGYYSYLSKSSDLSKKDGAVFAFNAFNTNAIPHSSTNQFINTLAYANEAAQQFLKVRCSELMFDINEAPKMYSQLRLLKLYAEDKSSAAASASASKVLDNSGQCFAYTGNTPKVLVVDSLREKFYEADEALDKDDGKIRVKLNSIKGDYEKDIAAQKAVLNERLESISNYYANIMALTARAKHKIIVADSADSFSILSDLRRSGAMAISKYMITLFTVVSDLSNSVKESSASDATYSASTNKGTLSLDVKQGPEAEEIRKNTGQTQMQLGEGVNLYLNIDNDFTAYASAQQSQLESERSITEEIVNSVIDSVIPGSDTLKEGFGFDEDKTLTDSLNECSLNSSNCLNFTESPVITLIKYGNDLMNVAINVYMIVTLMDTVSGLVEDVDDVVDAAIGSLGSKDGVLKSIAKVVTKAGKFLIKSIVYAVKAVTDLIEPLVYLLLGAGITLFFITALAPLLAHTLAWLNVFLEALVVFALSPLLSALALIKVNKRPLFSITKLAGMYASLIARPPLLVVAFIIYYLFTYIGVFMLNVMVGGLVGNATNTDIGAVIDNGTGISNIVMTIVMLCIFIFLLYKVLMHVNKISLEAVDASLKYVGIDGFSVNTITSTEGMIGGAAITGALSKVMGKASGAAKQFGGKAKEIKRQQAVGAEKYKKQLQAKLNESGHDIDLDSFDKGGR